jgi:Spy/CpxP family protein refolding chaperone
MKSTILTAILLFGLLALLGAQSAPCGDKHSQFDGKDNCQMDRHQGPQCDMDGKQGAGPGMDMFDMGPMDDLKLTDDQKERIRVARDNHRKEIIPINASIETLEIDLHADLRNNQYQDAIKVSDQISDKRKLIAGKRIQLMATIAGILTPEQLKIMKERREQNMRGPDYRNDKKDKSHREGKDKDE